MITFVKIVLGALATYRLTLLIVRDQVPFGALRRKLVSRFSGSLIDLIQCAWCMSMWVAAVVVVLNIYEWRTWRWFELVFTFSAVTGFLSEFS